MERILTGTRYLIIVPVLGLVIAAAFFFVFGGISLLRLLLNVLTTIIVDVESASGQVDRNAIVVEVVEFVHLFPVGSRSIAPKTWRPT